MEGCFVYGSMATATSSFPSYSTVLCDKTHPRHAESRFHNASLTNELLARSKMQPNRHSSPTRTVHDIEEHTMCQKQDKKSGNDTNQEALKTPLPEQTHEIQPNLKPTHTRQFHSKKIALICFSLGTLRLHDNPMLCQAIAECFNAAAAAARESMALLPVFVSCKSHLPSRIDTTPYSYIVECVRDLRANLRKHKSDLLVLECGRPGMEMQRVHQFAREIGAAKIFVDPFMGENVDPWKLEIGNRLTHPLPCPSQLPPLPLIYPAIQWRFGIKIPIDEVRINTLEGETAALDKLARFAKVVASFPTVSRELLLSTFRNELAAGSLSVNLIGNRLNLGSGSKGRGFISSRSALPHGTTPAVLFSSASLVTLAATKPKHHVPIDVNGPRVRDIVWNEKAQRFQLEAQGKTDQENELGNKIVAARQQVVEHLKHVFFPEDVSPDYYNFTAWRFVQRIVSSIVGVFGTQALLMALGIKSGKIGRAATVSWIVKDGLGRVGKMAWAGGKGKDFDVDPKRWRFRSALMYAVGNGLEIVTQIFPASFVLLASLATTLKQTSMLTASATRNAFYRSFGGVRDNIANITAKGEAQIVVADLVGMTIGVQLSKWIALSRSKTLIAYVLLSILDVGFIYKELQQVIFRSMNPERACLVIKQYLLTGRIMAPVDANNQERIFLPPQSCPWGTFTRLSKLATSPQEMDTLLHVFKSEKFMVNYETSAAVNQGTKSAASHSVKIVLRTDARSQDMLIALLTRAHVIRQLRREHDLALEREKKGSNGGGLRLPLPGLPQLPKGPDPDEENRRRNILESALKKSAKMAKTFKEDAIKAGWKLDHLVFSVSGRAIW